ncbi:hypothetical protein T484DRAFT_1774893 [Baffinella frigidus]|nr:hypothetical protein T484DRAFT_1774893 [Cryptophyta sp. CCMP2293]
MGVPTDKVRVLHDYIATEKGVLSLRAGEVCTLEENKEQGWVTLKTPAGQVGYFPNSYIDVQRLDGT